jgi:hypothetical protein
MVSLMNALSAAGAGVASFAGQAGLEQQKADLAQQGIALSASLAHQARTAEIEQAGTIAATAAEAAVGQKIREQAPALETQLAVAKTGAAATVEAATLSSAATRYSADMTSKLGYAQLDAMAPERAAQVAASNATTLAQKILTDNATDLRSARGDLETEVAKDTPDPAKLATLRSKITALETSATTQAALVTAQTAIYRTDMENVQQLNTRLEAATAHLNSPEMEEGAKPAQRALIQDLQAQLRGAQLALKFSSQAAHGAVSAATGVAPPQQPPAELPPITNFDTTGKPQ